MNITYRYERTGNYPGNGKALGAELARHHILSYPFMRSFAVVTFWYMATHESDSIAAKAKNKLDDFYQARGVGIGVNGWFNTCKLFKNKSNLELEVEKASGFLNWICWAESNLFIGPAGKHRLDDPSQKMDQFPLNMDKAVKHKATEVKKAWDKICASRLVGEKDQMISLSINDKELPNFVEIFVEYICLSKPKCIYESKYKDWAAYPTTGKSKPHQFWLNLSQPNNDIKDKRYKFALRDEAAKANEPWVCIKKFDADTVMGIEKGDPGSGEYDKTF